MHLTIDGRDSCDEVHGLKNKHKSACPTCDTRTVFKPGNSTVKICHRGRAASASVPSRRCVDCGYRMLEGSDAAIFRLTALHHLLKTEVRDPELLAATRALLNLKNNDLATLFGRRREDIWRILDGKEELSEAHWKSLTGRVRERLKALVQSHRTIEVTLTQEQSAA